MAAGGIELVEKPLALWRAKPLQGWKMMA